VIEDILNVAYKNLTSKTLVDMTKFYNGITTALKLYEDRKIIKNKLTTTTTDKHLTHTNLKDPMLNKVIDDDATCDELEKVNNSKRSLESDNSSESNKRSKIISNSTDEISVNPDLTPKDRYPQRKSPTISCETPEPTNSLMTINIWTMISYH